VAETTPQVEEGFVRIANELYDAILRAPFSKRELLIVLAVIRKTYGYGKKSDDMTMTQLAELTGLTRAHASETVRDLASKNVILIRDGQYGKIIAISKTYRNWNFTDRPKSGTSRIRTRPESGSVPSQNGIIGVPKRDPERPESGSTIDNPNRQPQKTTPKDRVSAAVTAPTWSAYSAAYENRYGVPPVSNAKVNGQLAGLIRRIGADDAPHVAAFYVQHNNGYYVRRGHSVDALLADCEKLRTEWATNRRMTDTQARQIDQTAATGEVFRSLISEAQP